MFIALVTGSYKGIGLQIVKELLAKNYHVIMTAKDLSKAEPVFLKLKSSHQNLSLYQLDVRDMKNIDTVIHTIELEFNRLDVLINNAGVFSTPETSQSSPEEVLNTFNTNTLAPFYLCQMAIPLMKKNNYGRIVNISSGMGQLSEMEQGYPAYRISKTALNAVTKIFSKEHKNILVNSVCPGWVRTDMGGPNAPRDVVKGAQTPVWLATLKDNGPTGKFFRDLEEIPW